MHVLYRMYDYRTLQMKDNLAVKDTFLGPKCWLSYITLYLRRIWPVPRCP